MNRLDQLSQLVEPGEGTFLFAFSGHGFSQGRQNYLAPYEASSSTIQQAGIELADITQQLQQTGAKRIVMLVDACRDDPNQPGAKSVSGGRSFIDYEESEGHSILFSTKFGRKSWEYSELQHGVFSHYVIKGLEGAASNDDGHVTFRSLADYVRAQVKEFSFQQRQIQVPFTSGEQSGDFLLAQSSPSASVDLLSYLSVKTQPENARVRILNIKPRYREGMELAPGRYHVEVSAPGYDTKRQWVTLQKGPQTIGIELKISDDIVILWDETPEVPDCTFPDTPNEAAPNWICDAPIEGVQISTVGSFRSTKAGVSFQKDQAVADARKRLIEVLKVRAKSYFHKLYNRPISDQLDALISTETLVGRTLTFRTKVNPITSRLYVLVGIPPHHFDSIIDDILNTTNSGKKSTRAALRINSSPSNAIWYLNGEIMGVTPDVHFNLEPGNQKVTIEKAGYRDTVAIINVKNDSTLDLHYPLIAKNGPKPQCTFDETQNSNRAAPKWICEPLDELALSAVGSFRKTAASVQFQKTQAVAAARAKLSRAFVKHLEWHLTTDATIAKLGSKKLSELIDRLKKEITPDLITDTRVYRTIVNHDTGTLFALIGLEEHGLNANIENILSNNTLLDINATLDLFN